MPVPDHPRRCGENHMFLLNCGLFLGSPPRMRGKLLLPFQARLLNRDHPRGCGENLDVARHFENGAGSPPRMRGKPSSRPYWLDSARITPADAGKTELDSKWKSALKGSPPRMRGKLCRHGQTRRHDGITPADAGKTQGRNVIASIDRDHPRGCGENEDAARKKTDAEGSPPRMRGKHTVMDRRADEDRITPADAGKTWSAPVVSIVSRDHPRGCGENTWSAPVVSIVSRDHPRGCGENWQTWLQLSAV